MKILRVYVVPAYLADIEVADEVQTFAVSEELYDAFQKDASADSLGGAVKDRPMSQDEIAAYSAIYNRHTNASLGGSTEPPELLEAPEEGGDEYQDNDGIGQL